MAIHFCQVSIVAGDKALRIGGVLIHIATLKVVPYNITFLTSRGLTQYMMVMLRRQQGLDDISQ